MHATTDKSDQLRYNYIWPLLPFLPSYSELFYLLIVSAEGYCCTLSHSMTHTHTHTLSRIPLDKELALCSYLCLAAHNIHKSQTFMYAAGFKPATPSNERPQTYTLDRAAAWISNTIFQAFMFSGAVAELLKATLSFFISVCLNFGQSARTDKLGSHIKNFYENCYLNIFPKSVKNIKISLKSDKNNRYFTWRPIYIFYHISHSSF
jgi:hypothetical protein